MSVNLEMKEIEEKYWALLLIFLTPPPSHPFFIVLTPSYPFFIVLTPFPPLLPQFSNPARSEVVFLTFFTVQVTYACVASFSRREGSY